MLHIDDSERIDFLRTLFSQERPPKAASLSVVERARVTMALLTLLNPRKGHYLSLIHI